MNIIKSLLQFLRLTYTYHVRILMVLLIFLSATGISFAQNNLFKMDDGIYKYYLSIHDSLGHASCPVLCNNMFNKALKKKDMMGQSIALQMKATHYVILGDITKLKTTFEEAKACKTIKLNYRYVIWKQLISLYLGNEKMNEAHLEILKMQKDAIKEKSDYGIVKSYFLTGIYFTVLNNHPAAIEQYKKGFDIAGNNYLLADPIEAVNFAGLLLSEKRFEEAIHYINFGLGYPAISDRHRFTLYLRLLVIYSQPEYASDKERAKDIKDKLEAINEKGHKWDTSISHLYNYGLFNYYMNVEKNYPNAHKYVNSLEDSTTICISNAELAKAEKDYVKAFSYLEKANDIYLKKQKKIQLQEQNAYNLRSSLDETLRERDRLLLSNTQLLLDKSREHEAFLQLDAEGRKKELDLKNTELSRQKAESKRQSELVRHQQKELQQVAENEALIKQAQRWRIAFSSIAAILIFGALTVYILMHHQKEKMLRAQRDKAQEDERMKSLFLQNMSHEIRTPLNAIIGFNDIINNDDLKELLQPGEREELLTMIHTNSDLLSTLVNDVLDISKFESGTYNMNFTEVNIHELCKTTLESVKMRAKGGVRMIFSPCSENISLHTDGQRLQQVITNFLTNACKYTSQGSITLNYDIVDCKEIPAHEGPKGLIPPLPAGKYIRFAVTDTGTGIPKGEEESCFTRFQMLDKNVKGTGLGLHICRLISQMLHGRVYVDTSYTQGARFIFDHPL